IDNLAAALNLDAKDGSGWQTLQQMVSEPGAAPDPQKKGIFCAPAGPNLDDKQLEALTKATQTNPGEWGYPSEAGVEVRSAAQANAQIIEKLGLHLVRVLVDTSPAAAAQGNSEEWTRVVTPSGKVGFVKAEALNPLETDLICYSKEGGNWRIAGFVGGA